MEYTEPDPLDGGSLPGGVPDPPMDRPEDEGYAIGSDACIDRCWERYYECMRSGASPEHCRNLREACIRTCKGEGVSAEPCDVEGCPTCAAELQLSNPCQLQKGHDGSHQCSNGHTW